MATKITVNGIQYESVGAMPPDAKRAYDQLVATLPEMADRDGDGVPDALLGQGLTVKSGTTIRRKIIVNGVTYDDVKSMPPDVREKFEQAMRAAGAGDRTVTRRETRMTFEASGPNFSFHTSTSSPSPASHATVAPGASAPPVVSAAPIEPAPVGGMLHFALIALACGVAGLVIWLVTRGH